jgi:hypothetical protein
MSPEQASGGAADFRSDQFSFGTMLYELASGQHPFRRDTPAQTLAAIIEDDPAPLATIAPKVALPLRWIIERCLAKAPADRYGSTDDLARDLARVRDHLSDLSGGMPVPGSGKVRRTWAVVVPAAALAVAAIAWLVLPKPTPLAVASPPEWAPVTFHQGFVHTARFAGNGQTILYSAAFDGRPVEIYSTSRSSPESQRLDLPPAGLMAISSGGELALGLECSYQLASGLCLGTLARAPLLGGAPRSLATDVLAADWGPGGELATVHRRDGRPVVEFPQGTVVSEPGATHVRFSRDGRRLAWTTPASVFVREGGETRVVSSRWEFISGLAWSASGDALFVSGVRKPDCVECVMRVADGESERPVLRGSGRLRVLDVGVNGEFLVDSSKGTNNMVAWRGVGQPPAPLAWFDGSIPDALSRDGATVLFTERRSVALGRTELYPMYVRGTDGGPATRLGTGYGLDLSPDGRWALTSSSSGQPHLELLPLGPGSARALEPVAGRPVALGWFVDNQRVIFESRQAGAPARTYVQSIDSGPPQLVAHEAGSVSAPVAPDGRRFISRRNDGSYWLASLDGQPSERLTFQPSAAERIVGWTANGTALLVASVDRDEVVIDQVDLELGTKTPLRRERSPFRGISVFQIHLSRDGSVLVAGGSQTVSTAYVVTGVR